MSQPCDRSAEVAQPGDLDESLKEFWSENPWDIASDGHNLSSFERNRTWFNLQGTSFVDLSFLSGTDSDGDGRGVVAGDFRGTGQMDMIVRQISGGPLHLYENQMPPRHYLTVSLRGVTSNRLGIGARLVAEVGGRQLVRELYPSDGFRAQMPSRVHFGLGDASSMDRLTIRWPGGEEQVLSDVVADRHILVTEGRTGAAAVETVIPGELIAP